MERASAIVESSPECAGEPEIAFRSARAAQAEWRSVSVSRRLAFVKRLRGLIVEHAVELADLALEQCRSNRTEKLAAEIVPLADSCRFLERDANRLLKPERYSSGFGRPIWLAGCRSVRFREPFGIILIIAPGNYPLLLAGVQATQALVAGNAVLWKPAPGQTRVALAFRKLAIEAGLDPRLLVVLPDTIEAAQSAMAYAADKVVFTGAARTGRTILERLAERLVPAVMELSGCDPCFVLESADLDLAARSLAFGLRFNGSETCIAPRRVFVLRSMQAELESKLLALLPTIERTALRPATAGMARDLVGEAVAGKARLIAGDVERLQGPFILSDVSPEMAIAKSDLFAPWLAILPVESRAEMLEANAKCPFGLSASIFVGGEEPKQRVHEFADRVRAGSVVINDLIVPTADPRTPFGGFGASGFGSTQGAEGLLELTVPKIIIEHRGKLRPHLDPIRIGDDAVLCAFLKLAHGASLSQRLRALKELVAAVRARGGQKP